MAVRAQRSNRFAWKYRTDTLGTTTPGVAVTPGASNVEGSWTEIASAANIAQDVYGLLLVVSNGSTAANTKDHLLDVGWDPAGGTSYVERIPNVVCGGSNAYSTGNAGIGGKWYYFPFLIPAGSAVAIRIQGSNATAGTVKITATFYGMPSHPELLRVGQYAETVGTITNSGGVSFTPGNAANGSWVSLGTTTNVCWFWQIGVQNSGTALGTKITLIDLAYGDATNKHPIIEGLEVATDSNEAQSHGLASLAECFCEVPAGATLYIRGSGSSAVSGTWNAVAVGIGG